jgi:hypothetical protein
VCLADFPHPIFNFLSLCLALSTISLLIVVLLERYDAGTLPRWNAVQAVEPLADADDSSVSPEGMVLDKPNWNIYSYYTGWHDRLTTHDSG